MSESVAATPDAIVPNVSEALASLSDSERTDWLRTGDLPDQSVLPESESGTSDLPPVDGASPSAETPVEPVKAARLPPNKNGNPRTDMNARLGQQTERTKEAVARAEAAERERDELRAKIAAPSGVTPAATQVAPAAPVVAAGTYVYKTPKGAVDFSSGDPEVIRDQFSAIGYEDPYAAMTLYAGKAEIQFQRQADYTQHAYTQRMTQLSTIATAGAEKYADWDAAVSSPELNALQFPQATKDLIYDSDLSVDVLYHLSKHPAEARLLAAMEPLAAAKALGKLETQFAGAPSPPATKTLSSAPPPILSVGRRVTVPARSDADQAVKDGNFRRFMDAENAEVVARRSKVAVR